MEQILAELQLIKKQQQDILNRQIATEKGSTANGALSPGALEAILSTQRQHSILLAIIFELLASPGGKLSTRDLAELACLKISKLEEKMELTPLGEPLAQEVLDYERVEKTMLKFKEHKDKEIPYLEEEIYKQTQEKVLQTLGLTTEEIKAFMSDLENKLGEMTSE